MHVVRVQRWVMSALILTTAFHFVSGLIILAVTLGTPDAFWVLTVIATIVTVLSIAGTLHLNQMKVLNPWLLVGILPVVAAFYFR